MLPVLSRFLRLLKYAPESIADSESNCHGVLIIWLHFFLRLFFLYWYQRSRTTAVWMAVSTGSASVLACLYFSYTEKRFMLDDFNGAERQDYYQFMYQVHTSCCFLHYESARPCIMTFLCRRIPCSVCLRMRWGWCWALRGARIKTAWARLPHSALPLIRAAHHGLQVNLGPAPVMTLAVKAYSVRERTTRKLAPPSQLPAARLLIGWVSGIVLCDS